MFSKSLLLYAFLGTLYSTVFASPSLIARTAPSCTLADAAQKYPQLLPLADGNEEFRYEMETEQPGLLEDLTTNGQHPEYLFFGCRYDFVAPCGRVFVADGDPHTAILEFPKEPSSLLSLVNSSPNATSRTNTPVQTSMPSPPSRTV